MRINSIIIAIFSVCALQSGAQTFTREYEALVDSAYDCIKTEKWAQAEEFLIKALRSEPANKSNYLLWANLGMTRNNKGDDKGALEAYDIGLAMAPKSTSLLIGRARTHIAMQRPEEALKDLDLALEVDSTLEKARKFRCFALVETGQIDVALKDINYYETIFGKDPFVSRIKADAHMALNDPEKATESLKDVYDLTHEREDALSLLSVIALYGNVEQYGGYINDLIKKFPNDGNMYLFRAALNKSRFQIESAESDLKRAESLGYDKSIKDILQIQ
ncbi:MAG: hypothetical protein K2G67_01880 [Muribaculaceae bacterium]|nr:hypothetical protein [Muribaculaceae bacterium]